jgi:chromosomal replication initiator protein
VDNLTFYRFQANNKGTLMTNEELWKAVLGEIELSISKANFSTWFKETAIISNENGQIIIGVPNGFAKEWLENKFKIYILRALRSIHEDIKDINCVIYAPRESDPLSAPSGIDAAKAPVLEKSHPSFLDQSFNNDSNLNSRYIFQNFIIGENNELARAACYAVSQNLGNLYNPLFIYGGVGLGKTHLLQSIGNEIILSDPAKKVCYTTSEKFTQELIDSIKSQKVDQFKSKYQQYDLLIIDDIQFLSGKEKTQNEFFHIFNALYQLNKQIVISSDRPPKAIPTLEERLRSRFEGGMIADISKPDLETRTAILKAKSSEKKFHLDDEVIRFIAENVTHNIRELEGALNRIMAMCSLENTFPTIEKVKDILSEIISSSKRKGVNHRHIIRTVSEFYEIEEKDLVSKGRKKEIVLPRQIAMFLLRRELKFSYPGIGEQFGGRDHTTALHAYEKILKDINQNEKLKKDIDLLIEKIYSL